MGSIIRSLKNFILLTMPSLLILFLILEVVSRIFVPGAHSPHGYFDEEARMAKCNIEKGSKEVFAIGPLVQQRGRWSVNNAGWNRPVDYRENGKRFESSHDRHWNVYGHAFVAGILRGHFPKMK